MASRQVSGGVAHCVSFHRGRGGGARHAGSDTVCARFSSVCAEVAPLPRWQMSESAPRARRLAPLSRIRQGPCMCVAALSPVSSPGWLAARASCSLLRLASLSPSGLSRRPQLATLATRRCSGACLAPHRVGTGHPGCSGPAAKGSQLTRRSLFPPHRSRPSTASGGYLTAEDAESGSRPGSAATTAAVTADSVSRQSSLETGPQLSGFSQPSQGWPPVLTDEPPRSSSPPPASRPQSSAGARVRGGGGSSLAAVDWRAASAAPPVAAPPAANLRASVANIARPEDFPPVPERVHRDRHSRPTAVLESDEDDDDTAPLPRHSVDVFTDAVDDDDDEDDGDDVPGMPLPPPPPLPWRNLGPRPLSRDPEMEARKAAQEVKALTQEDEALIMRMSLPMRPLSLRPATAAGAFAGSSGASNGHVRSPPAPRLPPVSAAPATSQQRGYVSAMEWGWATDAAATAAPPHGGAPRVSRTSDSGAHRSSGMVAAVATVETAARSSMSRGGGRRLTTPPRPAAVPPPPPAPAVSPPPRVRVPPPVRPTTAAARTPVHPHDSATSAGVSTPPSSGRLDTFLARQMAFMQLYKERRQARETQQPAARPVTSTSRR